MDPLDGTVNYLYGLADWAVSIAAEVDGAGAWPGVVAVPRHAEVFTAVAGQGSWLHPAGAAPVRLRCNAGVPLGKALVATGFGYARARRVVQGEIVAAVLPQVRDIRRGGSCAVDLCSVAAGRVDAYYERGRQLLGLGRRWPDRDRGGGPAGRAWPAGRRAANWPSRPGPGCSGTCTTCCAASIRSGTPRKPAPLTD